MPYTRQFLELWDNVEEQYLDKKVPKQYQKKYGKVYDKKEVKSVAFAIANKLNIKIDKK